MNTRPSLELSRRHFLGATAIAGISGCLGTTSPTSTDDDDRITAVAGAFFMLYDLARNVAGDQLDVEDLVPVGAHGDDWEPDPGIIQRVAEADVFVYIDGFRGWSDSVAAALPSDYPDVVVIDAADGIQYIEGERGREMDPHFWMDPLKAKQAVDNIAEGFVTADPNHATVYNDHAETFLGRLDAVHDAFETTLSSRTTDLIIIGSHNSFAYWTSRYGFEIYSPVGIDPDAEPTPQEMDRVRDLVDEHDLEYILYDMYEPTRLAETLAHETGTDILPLSPIEATTEEQLDQGMGYVEHQLDINLETLKRSLGVPA